MTGFLSNIISRHLDVAKNVKPYIPSKFEPNALITGFSGEFWMVPNRENDPPFQEDSMTRFPETDSEEYSRHVISDTAKIKPTETKNVKPGSEMKINYRGNEKESGNQNLYKKKQAEQRHKETNSMNRVKQDTLATTSNNPNTFSSENIRSPIKPFVSKDNISKQKNHLHQNQNNKVLNEQSPNSGKLADFSVNPAEVKSGDKHFQLTNERTGNAEIFSQNQSEVPQWLKDWKNESGQESQIRESIPDSKPTIKVNIGRIEVKAIMQAAQSPPVRKISTKPKMSLDEYLKQRNGGSR